MRNPDGILEGVVDAIEEVDIDKTWHARLAMTFIVREGENNRILFRYVFDKTLPCDHKHLTEVARMVSQILNKEAITLATQIKNVLEPTM